MTQPKLSISADDTTVAEIKAAADDESESVSAWMVDAARAKLRNRALRLAVSESLVETELSADEVRAAYATARRSSTPPSSERDAPTCVGQSAASARAASRSSPPNSGHERSVNSTSAPAHCQSMKLEMRCSPEVRTTTSTGGSSGR